MFADGQGLIDVIQPKTDLTNVIKGAKAVIQKVADATQIRKKVHQSKNTDPSNGLSADSTETPEVIVEPFTESLAAERSHDEIGASAASTSIASASNIGANSMSPLNESFPGSPSKYTLTSPVSHPSTNLRPFLDLTRSHVEPISLGSSSRARSPWNGSFPGSPSSNSNATSPVSDRSNDFRPFLDSTGSPRSASLTMSPWNDSDSGSPSSTSNATSPAPNMSADLGRLATITRPPAGSTLKPSCAGPSREIRH